MVPSPMTRTRRPGSTAGPADGLVDDGGGLGQHGVAGGDLGAQGVGEHGGHDDLAGGDAVPGEADLVVGLAQVGLAGDAAGAVPARDHALDDDAGAGQRAGGGDPGPLVAEDQG